jgi:hypothetical protein
VVRGLRKPIFSASCLSALPVPPTPDSKLVKYAAQMILYDLFAAADDLANFAIGRPSQPRIETRLSLELRPSQVVMTSLFVFVSIASQLYTFAALADSGP